MGQSASAPPAGKATVAQPGQLPSTDNLTNLPVRQWTSRHVQQWLRTNELDFCAEAFARLSVNGVALRDITDADLQTDFRVAEAFQRRRLLSSIADLLRSEGVVTTADAVQKRNQAAGGMLILFIAAYCVYMWSLLSVIFKR